MYMPRRLLSFAPSAYFREHGPELFSAARKKLDGFQPRYPENRVLLQKLRRALAGGDDGRRGRAEPPERKALAPPGDETPALKAASDWLERIRK